MITCVFGLTACGSEEALSQYEQQKLESAKQVAVDMIPVFEDFKDEELRAAFAEWTADEVAYVVQNSLGREVDGYAFLTAIESFTSAYETIGNVVSIGEATAKIDDKQIIVYVDITGEKKDAQAEVILSNDMFMKFESASLNPSATMGDLMTNAGLNTLIGMGTVFVVLILICLIISCFGVIPKIQSKLTHKEEAKEAQPKAVEVAAPQAAVQEDLTDDLELVAVIAAAIAASEGAASTDGFVVRSIRKVRR